MAQIIDSPKKKKPRTSFFLGCFGFSDLENPPENKLVSAGGKKNRSFRFSSKRFSGKQSPAKTVPVDIAAVKGGDDQKLKFYDVTSEKKASDKSHRKPAGITGNVAHVPVTGQTINFNKTKYDKNQEIIIENSKKLDHLLDSFQHPSTCRNGLSRNYTIANTTHNNLSHLGSPEDKHVVRRSTAAKLSHSVTMPPPKRKKQPGTMMTIGKVTSNYGNYDSIIGMSILMVTLIIMLLWGKICAIVCTCAWFYFLPRFKARNERIIARKGSGNVSPPDDEVDWEEYKKKVVLDGFLKRNRRYGVGFL